MLSAVGGYQHALQCVFITCKTRKFTVPMDLENLENEKINFQAWKYPGNSLRIHMKLLLSIFLEEVNDHEGNSSIFYHKLLSWKILILTSKSPGKMLVKRCGNPEIYLFNPSF